MKADDSNHVDEQRIESLILAFDEALPGGSAEPADCDSTLPEPILAKLRGMEATLRMLEQARRDGFDDTTSAEPMADASPILSNASTDHSIAGQRIGRFELVRELGRGGYGVVFLAEDRDLCRQVALKIPRPEALVGDDTRRRFLREAQAAGALQHPNLVPMYEVGEDGPFCFLASAYCDGPTLAQWIREQANPVPARQAAQWVQAVARGVAHAHERGVLHRDIKPSNVLLDRSGTDAQLLTADRWVPRLTDFGLAKLVEQTEDETRTGALLGTLAYMSPEQAEGRLRDIGTGSDVYALGVILYELLAGRTPFRGESDVQTLQKVARGDVPRLSHYRPGLSPDLEAITLKCLEREPVRRYGSARELAEDLQRFLSGVPTLARPAGRIEMAVKWTRRRPAVAALIAVSVAATIALTTGSTWAYLVQRKSLAEIREHLYTADLRIAQQALDRQRVEEARHLLRQHLPARGQQDLRDFAWYYLWNAAHPRATTLRGHSGDVYSVVYSPDGKLLASGGKDHTVRIWDVQTAKCLSVCQGHTDDVNAVCFSPDGKLVASASDDGTVRLWDMKSGDQVRRLVGKQDDETGPLEKVTTIRFSPDGNSLACGGSEGRLMLWRTSNWEILSRSTHHSGSITCLAFSKDNEYLATGGDDSIVCYWTGQGELINSVNLRGSPVASLVFHLSGDEPSLITLSHKEPGLVIWDLKTLSKRESLPLASSPWRQALEVFESGRFLAVGTKDPGVQLIDRQTDSVRWLNGHAGGVWSLAVSPDARRLASASADATIKIWQLDGSVSLPVTQAATQGNPLIFSADGHQVAVIGTQGRIRQLSEFAVPRRYEPERPTKILGDFDGDGMLDHGTFLNGDWQWIASSAPEQAPQTAKFGEAFDVPMIGDWDGDGRDNLGVFYHGTWHFDLDGHGGDVERSSRFGAWKAGKIWNPVVGDWDGDGDDEPGVMHGGRWEFMRSIGVEGVGPIPLFANDRGTVVAGDWDGDGRDDIAELSNGGPLSLDLGLSGEQPEYVVDRPFAESPHTRQITSVPASDGFDRSFGAHGLAVAILDNSCTAYSVAELKDGRIVVAGSHGQNTDNGFAAACFHKDGHLDTRFGDREKEPGIVRPTFGDQRGLARAILPLPDGGFILGGEVLPKSGFRLGLVCYDTQGKIDTSFGGGLGSQMHSLTSESTGLWTMVGQADGKFVCAGRGSSDRKYAIALARFNSDGSLDRTFGNEGHVLCTVGSGSESAWKLHASVDGRITVAGRSNLADKTMQFVAARFLPDGSLDESYGTSGKVVESNFTLRSVTFTADGSIVAGSQVAENGKRNVRLMKFDRDGVLDRTFGANGIALTEFAVRDSVIQDLLVLPNGRVMATGSTSLGDHQRSVVVRFQSNGEWDRSFGNGEGRLVSNGPFESSEGTRMALDSAGRVLIAGRCWEENAFAFALWRLAPDLDSKSDSNSLPRATDDTVNDGVNPPTTTPAEVASIRVPSRDHLEAAIDRSQANFPKDVTAVQLNNPDYPWTGTCYGHGDPRIDLWDQGSRHVATLRRTVGDAEVLAGSPHGDTLAVAGYGGNIDVWDVRKRQLIVTLETKSLRINCIVFSTDGKMLAAADSSGMVTIWGTETFSQRLVRKADELAVDAVVFSPDSRNLATGGANRLIQLWDASTGELSASLAGHDGPIDSLAYSPDGRILASGSEDQTVRVWSISKRQEILTLRGHIKTVSVVAFSPDGQRLATIAKGELRLWDAPRSD